MGPFMFRKFVSMNYFTDCSARNIFFTGVFTLLFSTKGDSGNTHIKPIYLFIYLFIYLLLKDASQYTSDIFL